MLFLAFALDDLEPVSQAHSLVCLACPLIRSTRTVSTEHFAALPPGKPHDVLFLATLREPALGEGVPEHVRVKVFKVGLLCAPSEHLTDAVVSHDTAGTQPKGAVSCEAMLASFSKVTLDRLPGLVPERTGAGSSALSEYDGNVLVKIDICKRETC